jgi:1,2-diacylglycerol 3-alpha-glucosyltransferase
MNIALFSDSYLPTKSGIVTVVIQLRDALEALGHHVVIVTVATTPESRKETESDPNILRVKSIPLGLGTDQFFGFPNMRKIANFLREHEIDIIHCHTEFYVAHAAKKVGKSLHIPTIATTHTMWEDFYGYYVPMARLVPVKAIRKLVKRAYRKFYALINVSAKAEGYFKSDFILPHIPSAIIPNAIDTAAFTHGVDTPESLAAKRKSWNIAPDDRVLLFVGRIAEEKRVLELLDICIEVVKQRPNVKAVFAGNGPALEQMQKNLHKENLEDRIIFTGFINWTDLHTYYNMADIFMTASLSEMHSMTVLESLLSGLPVVARKDSSYFDTVYPGENGYLAVTDDEMKRNLLDLIADDKKRARFGKRSLEISQHFSLETHAKKTVAFYEQVIATYPKQLDEAALRRKIYSI